MNKGLAAYQRHTRHNTSNAADYTFKVAATREERLGAFRLIYESYLRSELCGPNPLGVRVTPHHLLPTSETFVANRGSETVGTISLILDGELGLPMETVYDLEVAQRRMEGYRLAEVCCLADRRREIPSFFPVFLTLCRLMAQYAKHQDVDQLFVAVHPRHARFYQRYMAFESIGDLRAYPSVRNQPAVALSLDLTQVRSAANYEKFFGVPIPCGELQPQPIDWADREYFEPFVDQSHDFAPLGHDYMAAAG